LKNQSLSSQHSALTKNQHHTESQNTFVWRNRSNSQQNVGQTASPAL